jgi:hypothetical protein
MHNGCSLISQRPSPSCEGEEGEDGVSEGGGGGGGFMEEEEEEGVFRADAVNEGTPSATEPINNTLSVSPGCFAHPGPRAFWPGSLCKGGQLSEGRRA